jgi:DNA recombination protein RmuC
MNEVVFAIIVGALTGLLIAALLGWWFRRQARHLAETVVRSSETARAGELSALLEQVRGQFAALSREALSANTDDFLKLAEVRLQQQTSSGAETLEHKKKLIDAQLEAIGKRLGELGQSLHSSEQHRREAHGSLTQRLQDAAKTTQALQATTDQLRAALANPQQRGFWGERMADDVLRLAGFAEGVNYVKQTQTGEGSRPDFSFYLPNEQVVHMDVKFPIANYLRLQEATEDSQRQALTTAFLKDVRQRVREVTTRGYIDPAAGTVDYVLVFIPVEQVYAFIHANDPQLLDDALAQKVVLCSPLTLYAVLAVMRQVAENFRLQRASYEILELFAEFEKQWGKYGDVVERLGKNLEQALKSYQDLTTTRTRQLERQLDRIQALRAARASAEHAEATHSAPASADEHSPER